MINKKVIERFMQKNNLEPYDAFMGGGKLDSYNPLYFNEDLELRSMFLDTENVERPVCIVLLYALLTGLYPVRDKINNKRTENESESVIKKETRNIVVEVTAKTFVLTDDEFDCLKRACHLASDIAFGENNKNYYKQLENYLKTGERD